jgi:urease accessory protein
MRSFEPPFGVRRSAFGVSSSDEQAADSSFADVEENRQDVAGTVRLSPNPTPNAERRTPNGCPDFLLLQLADSAFPAGGFVHSGGLEAAWQLGLVTADSLADWLTDALDQAGHGVLPLVGVGWDAVSETDVCAVDAYADAWITNHVAARASRAQGPAWIAAIAAAFPAPDIAAMKRLLRQGSTPGHFAPWFGASLRAIGVGRSDALRLFLFLHLRGLVSAAVRLSLVGPLAAQRIQAQLAPQALAVLAACADLGLDDLANLQPLHDCAHGHHDRLYSRLFNT